MICIEVKDVDDNRLNIDEDMFYNRVKKLYPVLWDKVLDVLQYFVDVDADVFGCKSVKYSESDLLEFFSMSVVVSEFEDLYFDECPDGDEIFVNYYFCDGIDGCDYRVDSFALIGCS